MLVALTLQLAASNPTADHRFALELLAILSAAALVAFVLRKLPQATIPGYLIAGAIIGPHALRIVGGAGGTETVGSLSTILLMFTIGLHMDIGALRSGLAPIAGITAISTVLMVVIGWPIGAAFGLPGPAAIAIGMSLSISSTAVVLRILEQKREIHRLHGRLAFGVLLMQDLVAVAMLAVIPLLASWAGAPAAGGPTPALPGLSGPMAMLARMCLAIGGIGAMIVLGRLAMPRMLRAAADSGETLLVISSALALAAAVASAALGFSPELGAFLAGFLLSSTPFRYQLAGQLVPLRDLFLAVFFTVLGLDLPLSLVLHGWWVVLIALVLTMAVKAVVIGGTSWTLGATGAVAAYAGLALAQGGEFSLVLLRDARAKGAISADQSGYAIAVVVLSLVATPGLVEAARAAAVAAVRVPLARWVRGSALRGPEGPADDAEAAGGEPMPAVGETCGAAIVAGFGPVGRAVADKLEKRGVRVTIVELNPRTVEKQQGLGRKIIYGDVANPEVLERAGVRTADAVILTVPDEEAVLRACRFVRQAKPDVFIAARVNALSKALQAMQLGADHTVVEEMVTAEAMAAEVMLKLKQRDEGEDTGPRLYQYEV